ncbi:MAG: hypothetical protein AB1668_00565 [Nanoarchaeota archaeon]
MKTKIKKIFTHWRVIILLLFVIFSLVAIQPHFSNQGAAIRNVVQNSSASLARIENPSPKLTPLAKERIIALDGKKVLSAADYYDLITKVQENDTINVQTNKRSYSLLATANDLGRVDLGLKVYDAPTSNLRKGLDLEGGTRVLLKPTEEISQEDFDSILDNLRERLNVYGLSDIVVRPASDLAGDNFILIEIAGITEEEIKELLAKQGKFEAKIGNETVFLGGKKDITYVCRSADCSGIDPRKGCAKSSRGYSCGFFFSISLSPEAAERQAQATKDLDTQNEDGGCFLSESMYLYLDDKEVDSLRIGCELKGSASTSIQISGGGSGTTQQEAVAVALQNMKKLQTVLITGSLPVKLDVVKLDTISPSFGKEFMSNVALIAVLALGAVALVVSIRYRRAGVVIPMVLTLVTEMTMLLGFAALVGWNLDLAAIAGIIVAVGTGVDHLIIIADEAMKGAAVVYDWKTKIKNAMFIVMGAYFTVLSGMLPLLWAGAGLLKGFALTTIAGFSFGVLIARPAYAVVIEILMRESN